MAWNLARNSCTPALGFPPQGQVLSEALEPSSFPSTHIPTALLAGPSQHTLSESLGWMSHRLEMNTGLHAWLGTRRPMNEAGRGVGLWRVGK